MATQSTVFALKKRKEEMPKIQLNLLNLLNQLLLGCKVLTAAIKQVWDPKTAIALFKVDGCAKQLPFMLKGETIKPLCVVRGSKGGNCPKQ